MDFYEIVKQNNFTNMYYPPSEIHLHNNYSTHYTTSYNILFNTDNNVIAEFATIMYSMDIPFLLMSHESDTAYFYSHDKLHKTFHKYSSDWDYMLGYTLHYINKFKCNEIKLMVKI